MKPFVKVEMEGVTNHKILSLHFPWDTKVPRRKVHGRGRLKRLRLTFQKRADHNYRCGGPYLVILALVRKNPESQGSRASLG